MSSDCIANGGILRRRLWQGFPRWTNSSVAVDQDIGAAYFGLSCDSLVTDHIDNVAAVFSL